MGIWLLIHWQAPCASIYLDNPPLSGLLTWIIRPVQAGSIEWFLEDQAFSPSYDLAPPPPPFPVSKLDRQHTGILRNKDIFLTGVGRGRGGAMAFEGEKAWSSITHSILSVQKLWLFICSYLMLYICIVEAQFKYILFSSYVFNCGASETLNLCFLHGENPPVL